MTTTQAKLTTADKLGILEDMMRECVLAAELADSPDDGGTCNFDTPAFKAPRVPASLIQQAAERAGARVSDFSWFGGSRWWWVHVGKGQAARRSRASEAGTKAMKRALDRAREKHPGALDGWSVCEYCQAD